MYFFKIIVCPAARLLIINYVNGKTRTGKQARAEQQFSINEAPISVSLVSRHSSPDKNAKKHLKAKTGLPIYLSVLPGSEADRTYYSPEYRGLGAQGAETTKILCPECAKN